LEWCVKAIIPTAPIQVSQEICFVDKVCTLVPLFKANVQMANIAI
jgi:hypothetical protein